MPHMASLGDNVPDNKVHRANMGPTWVLSAPDGPHVGPMNLAIRGIEWSTGSFGGEGAFYFQNITHLFPGNTIENYFRLERPCLCRHGGFMHEVFSRLEHDPVDNEETNRLSTSCDIFCTMSVMWYACPALRLLWHYGYRQIAESAGLLLMAWSLFRTRASCRPRPVGAWR